MERSCLEKIKCWQNIFSSSRWMLLMTNFICNLFYSWIIGSFVWFRSLSVSCSCSFQSSIISSTLWFILSVTFWHFKKNSDFYSYTFKLIILYAPVFYLVTTELISNDLKEILDAHFFWLQDYFLSFLKTQNLTLLISNC